MKLLNQELYKALVEAGASEESAANAAETTMEVPNRLSGIDTKVSVVEARLAVVEKLLWAVVLGVVGLLLKDFWPA